MKYIKTFEELNKNSLIDMEAKITDYFDEAEKGNQEKRDGLYALISVLKDENQNLYQKYKARYNKMIGSK